MRVSASLALGCIFVLSSCSSPEVPGVPETAPQAVSDGTVAPDLLTVGNFRPGEDVNGNNTTDTYTDFTFDAQTTVASCCSRFQLVPTQGEPLEPITAIDVVRGEGTTTLTVAFEGTVAAADIARGTVDKNTVRVTGGGSNTNNPPQAAAVSSGGNTNTPDLVSVSKDGDQLLFEFDESITEDDDVVQNSAGLRFYTQKAETYNSSNVEQESETTLRAIYDLPQDVTLDDAVGGYVVAGTVVGNDLNPNELDETAPINDTGAAVCPRYSPLDRDFIGAGPTEAPDLAKVGNFRRGPATDDFGSTTCVDFSFDQVAYLNGGNRSSFHLVPQDGSDALDGSTNQTPESDEEGDEIVTVIFPGDLNPESFSRGFVDTGVVNSSASGASTQNPYNINQSEDISGLGQTENPDLVRVSREGNAFLFEFDEPLTSDDVAQNSSGFRLYFPMAEQSSTIPFASSSRVEVVDDTTLRAFYEGTLPGDYSLADAVGAYVTQGSVQAAQGSRGGNDGKNAFDETFIMGLDFPTLTPLCNGMLATVTGSGKINGTSGDDVIVGSAGSDRINSYGGNDIVCGRAGNDSLLGWSGDDVIFGEQGNDRIRGQYGNDTLYGGRGGDRLLGNRDDDDLYGEGGADVLRGQVGSDLFDGGIDSSTDTSDYNESEDREQVNVP